MARRPEGATAGEEGSTGTNGALNSPNSSAGKPTQVPAPDHIESKPRLVLPPDWLPLALLGGDALIAAISVPFAYWIRYGKADQALPIGPYLAAIPVVVVVYLFSLAVNHQYTSWRGRTLADQLLSLYSGIGVAAIVMVAAIEAGNRGQSYSRLT